MHSIASNANAAGVSGSVPTSYHCESEEHLGVSTSNFGHSPSSPTQGPEQNRNVSSTSSNQTGLGRSVGRTFTSPSIAGMKATRGWIAVSCKTKKDETRSPIVKKRICKGHLQKTSPSHRTIVTLSAHSDGDIKAWWSFAQQCLPSVFRS